MLEPSHVVVKSFKSLKTLQVSVKGIHPQLCKSYVSYPLQLNAENRGIDDVIAFTRGIKKKLHVITFVHVQYTLFYESSCAGHFIL